MRMKMSKTKTQPHYRRWEGMKSRCYIKTHVAFERYGGRGIFVCDEWKHSFKAFQQWCNKSYQPGTSLDRIDNNGPYSPENCKWSTPSEQMMNARYDTPKQIAKLKKMWAARKEPQKRLSKL